MPVAHGFSRKQGVLSCPQIHVSRVAIHFSRDASSNSLRKLGVSLPRERFWDIPAPKLDPPTRQPLCPGHPAVGAGLDQHTPSPTPPTNGLMACRMSLQIFSAATGNTPHRHCENPPGPTPTGDYQPSLRSPWLAASVRLLAPLPASACCFGVALSWPGSISLSAVRIPETANTEIAVRQIPAGIERYLQSATDCRSGTDYWR